MVATPIPPHIVHTVFQYILPPSLPLPPHLLSKRLIERHHFLSVSPTDPASYLCWPSPDAAEVTEALERGLQDALTSELEHDVRYTAPDEETVLAHVRPNGQSPLQIVFAWDAQTESWRYHDARMLPFPEASLSSLDATLANRRQVAAGLEWPSVFSEHPSRGSRSPSPASDNYWAGYESSGSSPGTSALPPSVVAEEDDKAEAAYWASYSIVQGSGDSTMPSPRVEKRRFAQNPKSPSARGPETTFDPLVAHLHLRLQHENGLLSPRFSHSEFVHSPHATNDGETPVDDKPTDPAPLGTEKEVQDDGDYGFPKVSDLKMVGPSASEVMCESGICIMASQSTIRNKRDDGEEDAVKEALRGVYRMWKAQSESRDTTSFLEVVKSALEI